MAEMDRTRFWMALEDAFIIISIFALWPVILGWDGWVWEVLKYAAAGGWIWIFTRRVKRYKERAEEKKNLRR